MRFNTTSGGAGQQKLYYLFLSNYFFLSLELRIISQYGIPEELEFLTRVEYHLVEIRLLEWTIGRMCNRLNER